MQIHPLFIQSENLSVLYVTWHPDSKRICELNTSPNMVPPAPEPPLAREEELHGHGFTPGRFLCGGFHSAGLVLFGEKNQGYGQPCMLTKGLRSG